MVQLIRTWVLSCEQCFKGTRTDQTFTRLPMQNPNDYITVPEDAMQIDMLPDSPASGGYEIIVTAMNVFSRYLLASPHMARTQKHLTKS